MNVNPLDRVTFGAGSLIQGYPPRWHDRNKRLVFDIACSSGFPFDGEVSFAVWKEETPPNTITTRSGFCVRAGFFEYAVPSESTTVAWHLNFADPHLFFAYGSSLLAQDKLQVAEHPILGSVREALISQVGITPRTVDERQRPTPVTVTGVQRRCVIDTRPNPAAGRPQGLYGNAFARAPAEQVIAATKPLSPPTISNILALAAPACGYGKYRREEMVYILNAAYTGFSVARRESERLVPSGSRTVIHTGFWGCGAFGGNKTLMTILQALAADLAGVDIVFWASDQAGVELVNDARKRYEHLRETTPAVPAFLGHLIHQGFKWGGSDGN